ncbi:MAG: hypothetical protein A3G59_00905 [Candidatus Taylorbacteria bacterium RIFCSPLOWO2_12_FULL_47_20]|uniref:Uncharacterized protein n=2 Tax=Candidatus Tayloriibacteriota TaxID=1817919 RepID=A0A1G2P7S3_9BACT|nr:MAG: hypothetical protein A3H68_01605 [Candidatus Taylorbacteria bacterium RIFCSPLOWO2_02_FULL_46_40]OHA44387.1 MAG: hypothetical protein A3G59_00905 [Candidatus Taylorbacteria bacterium RIFCSPLOWO2_12_FULL_47_20]
MVRGRFDEAGRTFASVYSQGGVLNYRFDIVLPKEIQPGKTFVVHRNYDQFLAVHKDGGVVLLLVEDLEKKCEPSEKPDCKIDLPVAT